MRTYLLMIAMVFNTVNGPMLAAEQKIKPPSYTGNKIEPHSTGLSAPSDLKLSDIGPNELTLSWRDNSTTEFGVFIERMTPVEMRGGILKKWEFSWKSEERSELGMVGTGLRSDTDIKLTPGTEYCYRMRAYRDDTRDTSGVSEVVCARTAEVGATLPAKYPLMVAPMPSTPPKKVRDHRGRSSKTSLASPSNLEISDVTRTSLTLSWQDNSTREFGVEIFRVNPVAARKDRKMRWKRIADVSERLDSNVVGMGLRSDDDFNLSPQTNYCYRVRAYVGFSKSEVSDFSNVKCIKTRK